MKEPKHTEEELKQLQALPLEAKIALTKDRVDEWVNRWGLENVAVSFSGGKDSTVLLDMCRQWYPDMKALFINTNLEFPEIVQFARSYANVETIYPHIGFPQVLRDYGYPIFGKEIARKIKSARQYIQDLRLRETGGTDAPLRGAWAIEYLLGLNGKPPLGEDAEVYRDLCAGKYSSKDIVAGKIVGHNNGPYSYKRYIYTLGAPFNISPYCCNVMKKKPAKATRLRCFTGQTTDESGLRKRQWLLSGCNMFDNRHPISNPMSFWTEQDVLGYIKKYGDNMVTRRIEGREYAMANSLTKHKYGEDPGTPIAKVYGDVIEETDSQGKTRLVCTGAPRTGCMYCAFGINRCKHNNKFLTLSERYPTLFDLCMRGGNFDERGLWVPTTGKGGGYGYWFVFAYVNKYGHHGIYIPNLDEYIEKYSTPETDKYLRDS